MPETTSPPPSESDEKTGPVGRAVAGSATVGLCLLHGLAIWVGLGGRAGISSPWPPANDDHPYYYHSALITRAFLRQSGTTAGYDPSFMAGYPKSILSISSSTLPELAIACSGSVAPAVAYKWYLLLTAASLPWLVACAARLWGAGPGGVALAVLSFLIYVWTDWPINYAQIGMLPYLVSVPLGLATTGVLVAFLSQGGAWRWLVAAVGSTLTVLVHLTAAMIVAPAALLAYGIAIREERGSRRRLPTARHLGFWAIPAIVLAGNAFWWLPAVWLASTKGASGFLFAHPEPIGGRLWQVIFASAPIQATLLALGLPGLVVLARRAPVAAAGLGGFAGAGFFWGYLAGGSRSLDFLQPGRQTYAFYAALTPAAAIALVAVLDRLRDGRSGRLDVWAAIGMALVGFRTFAPTLEQSFRDRLGVRLFGDVAPKGIPRERAGEFVTFLSSRPSPRLLWVVDRVRRHVRPGERLLYEEGGFALPGVPDPFRGERYSGLLPHLVEGVEVLGGPYLHVHVSTNFTQFGEGKLFGEAGWGRDRFVRYARLYRPSAILCWSPHARRFCRANPDLIEVRDDDGTLLIGRVRGFGGAAISGTAEVKAGPGRLTVSGATPGVDGRVVLRYHSAPYLRGRPPVPLEPVYLEGDPVPFLGLRPGTGTGPLVLELGRPP